jgi:hypothetical protein
MASHTVLAFLYVIDFIELLINGKSEDGLLEVETFSLHK